MTTSGEVPAELSGEMFDELRRTLTQNGVESRLADLLETLSRPHAGPAGGEVRIVSGFPDGQGERCNVEVLHVDASDDPVRSMLVRVRPTVLPAYEQILENVPRAAQIRPGSLLQATRYPNGSLEIVIDPTA